MDNSPSTLLTDLIGSKVILRPDTSYEHCAAAEWKRTTHGKTYLIRGIFQRASQIICLLESACGELSRADVEHLLVQRDDDPFKL